MAEALDPEVAAEAVESGYASAIAVAVVYGTSMVFGVIAIAVRRYVEKPTCI